MRLDTAVTDVASCQNLSEFWCHSWHHGFFGFTAEVIADIDDVMQPLWCHSSFVMSCLTLVMSCLTSDVMSHSCDVMSHLWRHQILMMSSVTIIFNCSHSYSYMRTIWVVYSIWHRDHMTDSPKMNTTLADKPSPPIPTSSSQRFGLLGRFGKFDCVWGHREYTYTRVACLWN